LHDGETVNYKDDDVITINQSTVNHTRVMANVYSSTNMAKAQTFISITGCSYFRHKSRILLAPFKRSSTSIGLDKDLGLALFRCSYLCYDL
jgi:hypothetical protein